MALTIQLNDEDIRRVNGSVEAIIHMLLQAGPDARIIAIVKSLLDWQDDINDLRPASIDVEIHCRGKGITTSVRKLK